MPIFMDRHNMPEGVTASDVAGAHHADMHIQDKHDVNFLTYWFDKKNGAVFCLAEAPDEDSLNKCHSESHGDVPVDIIPVDLTNVQAFLGRISSPAEDTAIASPLRSIMFTDLKGSTEMTMMMGDVEAVALLEIHDNLIRKAMADHAGHEIKHTGDGFLAAFGNVGDSVKCAVSIQRTLADYNRANPKKTLQVRIGINAGQPVERGGDLFGMVVNLASRICDHAGPDQIMTTGIVQELLFDNPELQGTFNEIERAYFKGFAHAVQVYEVSWR